MIHRTALVGECPEHRDYKDGDPMFHPVIGQDANIGAYATVDAGMLRPTAIGARTLVLKRVHIGHDAFIGQDCELAPGVTIGGECVIEDRVRIGINACVRPRTTIGEGARIGAGAVVVDDIPPGETWAGNPARRL